MKSLVKRAQRGDDQAFVELIEENKQDTIIPVSAPVKKSTTDFSCFIVPITLSLSIDCTIFETFYAVNSSNKYQSVEMELKNN